MKRTRLFLLAAFGLGMVFTSCNNYGEYGRQKLYNNATHADSEAFTFYKTSYEKVSQAIEFANYLETVETTADLQELRNRILEVYPDLLVEMEAIATADQVLLPDPGMHAFTVPNDFVVDSVAAFDPQVYMTYAAREQGAILEQFNRASRNTNLAVRKFAGDNLSTIQELYTLAGGVVEENSH